MNKLFSPSLVSVDYGADEEQMAEYRREGTNRALGMDNRGPLRFDKNGKLDDGIMMSYLKEGFYVLEGVINVRELNDLENDLFKLIERAPITKGAKIDKYGRPSFDINQSMEAITWVRPLSDLLGGTDANNGRHPARMAEPKAPEGSPEYVIQVIHGSLLHSEACLRLYGHPGLLAVAEAINGPDFTPFNEVIWVKQPGLGGSVAWHQDPWTHWESSDLDAFTHGFNFMAQLYGCDAANGLWVVPGSHLNGKLDIKKMVDAVGSDRLPDAVPLICGPGDVVITNRQSIHGSFANTSKSLRVTLNMGFHRRKSVLGVKSGGVHNPISVYDAAYIRRRSRMIMYAIDARRQFYPEEFSYCYRPLVDWADDYRWSPSAKIEMVDYNLEDIGI